MVIHKVYGSLSKDGFKHKVYPIEVSESKACYISLSKKRINKARLMQIDEFFKGSHELIHLYTYCIEGEQQNALNLLKAEIIDRAKKMKAELDELIKHL